jgi:hypothetical protein
MQDHGKPEVKSILLRNFAVIAIFIYLFASNIVGYSIHPFLIAVLIALAFFLSPIAKTFRYLRSLLPTGRK